MTSSTYLRTFPAAALLAFLGACAAQRPANAPKTAEDYRKIEARLMGGIEHFVALESTRPEMATVAYAAARRAEAWCNERSADPAYGYDCSYDDLARIREVLQTTVSRSQVPALEWAIVAPPRCKELVQVLLPHGPSPTASATLTLDDCSVVHTPSAWLASECIASAQSCPHPVVKSPPPSDCGDGRPCTQMAPQPMCTCFQASVKTHVHVSGRWTFGTWSQRFDITRDPTEAIAPVFSDTPPSSPPQPTEVWSADLTADLATAGLRLQTASATDLDERARYCTVFDPRGADPFGVGAVAHADCDDVYLREPGPRASKPVIAATPTKPALPPIHPSLVKDGYPVLAQRFTAEQIAATKDAIQRSAPDWEVTVGPLGFVTSASLKVAGKSDAAVADATRSFLATNFLYLGFDAPPPVSNGGETAGGQRLILGKGTSFLESRRTGDRAEIRAHLWPITCPSPDLEKLVRPFVGTPMTVRPPLHTCDPVPGVACDGKQPSEFTIKLTVADSFLAPKVVTVESSDPAQVELHCGAELHFKSSATPQRPIPSVIDVVTSANLTNTSHDEALLAPRSVP